MKVAAYCVLASVLAFTGCQSPSPQLPPDQAQPAGVEFKRASRVYEQGDAMFAVMNNSTRVLWFEGKGPEDPAYRLKSGQAIGALQNVPVPGLDGAAERFPLPPGESCYFEIAAPVTGAPASVGVTFYPSRSATNGMTMWSPPVALPPKRVQ
jgi:hypothetical protein